MVCFNYLRVLLDDLAAQIGLQLVNELFVPGLQLVHLAALLPCELLHELLAVQFADLAQLIVQSLRARGILGELQVLVFLVHHRSCFLGFLGGMLLVQSC